MLVGGIEQSEAGWLRPKLLRVKGELFLLQSSAAVRETPEDLFRQARGAQTRLQDRNDFGFGVHLVG